MKYRFIILIFILFHCTFSYAQFLSGNGDGHDIESKLNMTLENISLAILYDGGNGDGHDIETLLNTTLENISLTILYDSGNGDGHDIETLLNTTLENISLAILYDGGNGDGFSSKQENVFLNPNAIVDLILNIKALLQGPSIAPIDVGLMNDDLRFLGIIPTQTPYTDFATINSSVFNKGGSDNLGLPEDDVVDWVWVELRSNTDNSNIINSGSALIQRDGDVVALDGKSNLILEAVTGSYFVVVKHRNHNGIMSQNPISLSVVSTNINFVNNSIPTFGNNAQVVLTSSLNALWAGNTNNVSGIRFSGANNDSNTIKDSVLADPLNLLNLTTFNSMGYMMEDVNMNGEIKFSGTNNDSNYLKDNILNHPSNIFNNSTFIINVTIPNSN